MTRRVLVFGASGQIGRYLVPRLLDAGVELHAVSRVPPPDGDARVHWHRGELFAGGDPIDAADLVLSLGPLDGFAAWWERSTLRPSRVIAFGSTSATTKCASPDARERTLAARLDAAEARLHATSAARGIASTVLRPTLVYGAGVDRNLSRLAQWARRLGFLPLPHDATGLRQPVHAEDLADAAFAATFASATLQSRYDLPGGETIVYREMVQRVLACLDPPRRVITVPALVLRVPLALRRVVGEDEGMAAILTRMRDDLVFDASPAQRDLGFRPRAFAPDAAMFVSVETS